MAVLDAKVVGLADPVTKLKGVGPALAERLAVLNIARIEDLLFHLPRSYQDRGQLRTLASLEPGCEALVEALVVDRRVHVGRKSSLHIRLAEGNYSLSLRYFHFNARLQARLEPGQLVRVFGEVRRGAQGLEMIHPEFSTAQTSADEAPVLTPIYPATESLTQVQLRRLVDAALTLLCVAQPAEWIPNLSQSWSLSEALQCLHHPPVGTDLSTLIEGTHPALQRLAVEELVSHRLGMWLARTRYQRASAVEIRAPGALRESLAKQLGFELTTAQARVLTEIRTDLAKSTPMARLVQGDVGCGKTAVAALAAADVIEAGYQVAIMAPTELLAEQHQRSMSKWFSPLGVEVVWLSGRLRANQRAEPLEKMADGRAQLIVGTHALFQEQVCFSRLGAVIIDEQHRFGVRQRQALLDKARAFSAHQLTMTATPIPRTLAQTAYADLDLSVIDELPPGRQPVVTVALPDSRRQEVIVRMEHALNEGRQVYWVCPLVEDSELLEAEAAQSTFAHLCEQLPEQRFGLVHGRMKSEEKDQVMQTFITGDCGCLVATTVIEVGVDVPNASLMIIDNAERLGLSQLHQLRGRVGRGSAASTCVLLYKSPLGRIARARIAAMRESQDGFYIAECDLELRGPGEVLGTRQTGQLQFRVASLLRDRGLLDQVQQIAEQIWRNNPERITPLLRRWLGKDAEALIRI